MLSSKIILIIYFTEKTMGIFILLKKYYLRIKIYGKNFLIK